MNLELFYIVSATLVIVALMVILAITVYSWKRRQRVEVRYFLWFLASVIVWYLAAFLSFISPTPEIAGFWVLKVKFLGVITLPVTFLAFTLSYTGRTHWLRAQTYIFLGVIPAATQIMLWTTPRFFMTDLVFKRYGPYLINVDRIIHTWYWVHTAYSYSLVGISIFLLALFAARSHYLYRTQAIIMLGGAFFALIANALHVFKVITPAPPEFTALTFGGVVLVWGWALFRYRLLDIMPVARHTVVENMADAVIVLDVQNRIVDMNPAAHALTLTDSSNMIGKPLDEFWPGQQELIESYSAVKATQTEIEVDQGTERRVFDLNISTLFQSKGDEAGRLVVLRDITERKQQEEKVKESELLYRTVYELANDGICVIEQGMFTYTNAQLANILGYEPEEIENTLFTNYLFGECIARIAHDYQQAMEGTQMPPRFDGQVVRKDGTILDVEFSASALDYPPNPRIVVITRDVTEKRNLEKKLREWANTDPLIKIPNRRYFLQLAGKEVNQTIQHQLTVSFILFDLDHFKKVNDVHGHLVGDEILKQVAVLCNQNIRSSDLICRYGGEEFLIMLPGTEQAAAMDKAEKLRIALEEHHFETKSGVLHITASFGVSSSTPEKSDLMTLIDEADQALYLGKEKGRNHVSTLSQNP